ncbi:MAG TPA: hypothetical protein VF812_12920 [Ktedonobacterales bacterium]
MQVEDHPPTRSSRAESSRPRRVALWLLRLYPREWRDRYGDEVTSVLAEHHVTYWTALDLVLGAIDAHLHGDLLPRRLTSMAHRIRSSEIAIFCAFVLFAVAWLPLRLVRDPLPIWETAVAKHPALFTALGVLDLASLIAALAVLAGGLPLLVSALKQAVITRRWRLLALFGIPLLAAAALGAVGLADIPWSSVSQSGEVRMLQPVAVQLALILLLLVAVGGSAAAIATAVGRSEVSDRALRFALLPAGVATTALALGLLAAVALNALIFTEAPAVGFWPPMQVADLLVMLAAVVIAVFALRHGMQAARGGE